MAVFASSAFAVETREYTGLSFGPDGAGGTETFANVGGVAVDQASGDVYAYDSGASKIHKFTSAGVPVNFTATATNSIEGVGGNGGGESEIAVAPAGSPGGTAGDIYVANDATVKVYSAAGAELGTFATYNEAKPCGVAVSPAGHVIVDFYPRTLREYVPASNPPVNSDQVKVGNTQGETCSIAVDGAENLYAATTYGAPVKKLEGTDDTDPTKIEPGGSTIGTDPVTNKLFIDRGNVVDQRSESGSLELSFGTGNLEGSHGVASYDSANKVYVGDNGKIKVFGAPFVAAEVGLNQPTELSPTKATLNGQVNPGGVAVTSCKFEYGTTEALGASTPCVGTIPTDSAYHPVTAKLTGLVKGSINYYRLTVTNVNGTNETETKYFFAPEAALTEPATGITNVAATLNGTVFPEGEAVTECFFLYGQEYAFNLTKPCAQTVPTNNAGTPVSTTITGLTSGGQNYQFRLVVKQASGETVGSVESFTTKGLLLGPGKTSNVQSNEATLETKINPNESPTEYRFEYGETTTYSTSTPEAILGEGGQFQTAAEVITGLRPETTYHWRVVATDPYSETPGPDHTFTTRGSPLAPETGCPSQAFRTHEPSENLPDCRVYEQVSPVGKNGSNIQHEVDYVEASRNGERFVIIDNSGLPTTGGSTDQYVSSRLGNQWGTNGMVPAAIPGRESELLGWDEEIGTAFSSVGGSGFFLWDTASGNYEKVAPRPSYFYGDVAGYADDTKHLMFEAGQSLPEVPQSVQGIPNIYDLDHGNFSLVDLIPAGSATTCSGAACVPAPEGAFAGPYAWQGGSTSYGGASASYYTQNTISNDGTREIFTAAGTGALYLRENGNKTTKISASKLATPEPARPAAFVGATPDDSQVYFLSCERLIEGSTAVDTGENSCIERGGEPVANKQGMDLYRYETASGSLEDLTIDHTDPLGAGVIGVLGVSENGSYVYFAANGVLGNGAAEGATPGNCSPGVSINTNSLFCNIYVEHEGTIKFVTRIDSGNGGGGLFNGGSENWLESSSSAFYGSKAARVSNTGDLIFISPQNLDNYDPSCELHGNGCFELYRYQPNAEGSATQGIHCVSCNPTGANPTGDVALAGAGQVFGGEVQMTFLTRNLSANGDQVFFDTPDALVPGDTNGVRDVYEWEADGSGSCHSTKYGGGCIYLLSTGTSNRPSFFGDASASGNDVFIFTNQRLVPQDKDELTDAYDVRVDGGLASQYATAGVPCTGEACLGAGTSATAESSPGTANFSGPGNQKEKPKPTCKKKNQKQCKKKSKKKHHKKNSSNAKHKQKSKGKQHSRTTSDDRGGAK